MADAFICDGIRTPFGRYGGALSSVRADDLAAIPITALMERNASVDWSAVDDVIYGCANQAGEDNRNVARMASLLAGLSEDVPAVTVNRLCGSGMEAVAMAARAIAIGEADVIVAGGVESMSRAPYVMAKPENAFDRNPQIFDTTIGWRLVNPRMKQLFGTDSNPETAEIVADVYGISRAAQDQFAYRSQLRASKAMETGRLSREIVPVKTRTGKQETLVDRDEHPRPDTNIEALASLKPIVRPDGCVTAGNASGINDGACALLIASGAAVEKYGLRPRVKIVSTAVAGVAPRLMGMGPVPATRKLVARTDISLPDIGVIELNEAFAAQVVAVVRELGIPEDAPYLNPNGGAIALGHPLGASGARLVTTAMYELEETNARLALCTMCIGVGQGIAMLIERV